MLTAFEDGASDLPDPVLLDRASALGRALFTQDEDLLVEAVFPLAASEPFAGVVYAHQLRVSIGVCLADLASQIVFLPL